MPIMGGERSRISSPIYLIPKLDEQRPNCLKLEQAITNPNLMKGVDKYAHGVWIGVELTATAVLLDTVVPTAKLLRVEQRVYSTSPLCRD